MSHAEKPAFLDALEKEAPHLQTRARQFQAAYGRGLVVFRFFADWNEGEVAYCPIENINAANLEDAGFPPDALGMFTELCSSYNPVTEYALIAATVTNGVVVEVEGTTGQYLDVQAEAYRQGGCPACG